MKVIWIYRFSINDIELNIKNKNSSTLLLVTAIFVCKQ